MEELSFESLRQRRIGISIDPDKFYTYKQIRDFDLMCRKDYSRMWFLRQLSETDVWWKKMRKFVFTKQDLKDMWMYEEAYKEYKKAKAWLPWGAGHFSSVYVKWEDILRYMFHHRDAKMVEELRSRRRLNDLLYVQTGAINF